MEEIKRVTLINDKNNLSETITQYQILQEEILGLKEKSMTLTDYFRWRRRILPFLSRNETRGRHFLFDLAFIETLVCSERRGDREIALKIIINIIDKEFSHRIQEIGEEINENPN